MSFFARFCFLFIFLISLNAHGQIAGKRDPSFDVKPNYGPERPFMKAWLQKDGSVLACQSGNNIFDGKRLGSILKLGPDGKLDTTYRTPVFPDQWLPISFCNSQLVFPVFHADTGGVVSVLNGAKDTLFRVFADGSVFTKPLPNFGFPSCPRRASPFFPDGRFLAWKTDSAFKLRVYTAKGEIDTTVAPFQPTLQTSNWFDIQLSESPNGQKVIRVVNYGTSVSPTKIRYLAIQPSSTQFDLISERTDSMTTFQSSFLGMDSLHRLYEWGQNQIVRWKPTAILDSTFSILMPADLENSYWTDWVERIHVFPNGKVKLYVKGGQVHAPSFYPLNGYPFMDIETRVFSGGKWRIYDSSTGLLADSVEEKAYSLFLERGTRKVEFQKNKQDRWEWTAKDQNGQILNRRLTEWGANGPVRFVKSLKDGKVLIGGDFTRFDHWPAPGVARVLANGRVDTSFRIQALENNEEKYPKLVHLQFWREDESKGYFLAYQKPIGNQTDHVFHVRPDGTVVSGLHWNPAALSDTAIQTLDHAYCLASGDLVFACRLQLPGHRSQIIFLGRSDSTGQPRPGVGFFPFTQLDGIHSTSFTGDTIWPRLNPFKAMDANRVLIQRYSPWGVGGENPPCLPPPPPPPTGDPILSTPPSNWVWAENGISQPSFQPELVLLVPFDFPSTDEGSKQFFAQRFWNTGLDVFPGTEPWIYRLKSNLEIDSSFRFLRTSGPLGDYDYPGFPLLITRQGEYIFKDFKTNTSGWIDSQFPALSDTVVLAEADTNHLYVAGGFIQYRGESAPYLIRIHNPKGTFTSIKNAWKEGAAPSLYPNPVRQIFRVKNFEEGLQIRLVSVEGRVWYEGKLHPEMEVSQFRLPAGLYFWTIGKGGETLNQGRLINQRD